MAFPSDYNWKLDITTDSTQVDSNETDFPYYFDLSNISSTDFWNNVQSDGGDLRVSSDASGSTQLPLEVVNIDTGTQTGEIHFKDSTDSASNKTYYLWWEDSTGTVSQPAVSDTFGRNNVWTKYVAVYHLDETSGSAIDSTGNSNDGTYNGNLPTQVTGQLTNGQDLDGSGDYVLVSDSASLDVTNLTLSYWENPDSFSNNNEFLFDKNNAFRIFNDGAGTFQGDIWFSGSIESIDLGTSAPTGSWSYAVFGYDGSTMRYYLNNTLEGSNSNPSGNMDTSASDLHIGIRNTIVEAFDGKMDEIRIAGSWLGANWISTEYNMQSNNPTFWTEGTPEFLGATEKSVTFTADAVIQKKDTQQTFSFDARIQDEKSTSFTADTIIENLDIDNAFSVDTNIKQLDITRTFDIDTIISLQGDATFTADATLKNPIETTFSVDTNIFKADNQETFSFDTIIATPVGFSFDTLIKKQDVDPTFSFDAIIKEKQLDIEKNFLIDALVVTTDEKNSVATLVNDFDEILNAQGRQIKLIKKDEEYDSMNQYIGSSNEQTYDIKAVIFPEGQRNHRYNEIGNTSGGQQQAYFKDRYNVNGTVVVPREGDEFTDPQGKKWRITSMNEWVWSYEVIYVEGTIENIDLTGTTR